MLTVDDFVLSIGLSNTSHGIQGGIGVTNISVGKLALSVAMLVLQKDLDNLFTKTVKPFEKV